MRTKRRFTTTAATLTALLCAATTTACGGSSGTTGGPATSADQWQPADAGLIAWNYDPSAAATTWNPTARTDGTLFLTALLLRRPATLHEIRYGLSGAQTSGLATGHNLIGLYSSTGALLARTADQTPIWSDTADQKVDTAPWLTPYRAAAGRYYVAFLYNGVTTGLNFKASGAGATANAGAPAGRLRYSMIKAHATALPPSIDLARQTNPLPFNSQWLGLA